MKLGFIGTGNMASAIMDGIIRKQILKPEEIVGADASVKGRERVKTQFGIQTTESNVELAKQAEIIVLSVKPQFYETVITEIRDVICEEQIIITIAPGKSLEWVEKQFGKAVKIVRTMPNTPAMVGEGMTAACANKYVTDSEMDVVKLLFESFGKLEIVSEHLMDTVSAVSSASPAYIFVLIEAMADAAVSGGIPRGQAYKFVAQAVLGSAKMVLETGKHPGELKDMVCSPAGATIEAIRTLEEKGFRSAVIEAVKICEETSGKL